MILEVETVEEKTVSFYRIAREIYDESDKIKLGNFENFRKKRQTYLETMLRHAGMLEKYKTGKGSQSEFKIPEKEKDSIKALLLTYAEPVSRKIRQNKLDEITPEEVNGISEKLSEIVDNFFPESERMDEKGKIAGMLRATSRLAFEEVETGLLKMMSDDLSSIGNLKLGIGKKAQSEDVDHADRGMRIFHDFDAAYLMYYYYKLLKEQSEFWNEVVEEVDSIRFEEIMAISERELDTNCEINIMYETNTTVLARAIKNVKTKRINKNLAKNI